jgi:Ca2+-binding EF-hand superfamily protein
MSLAVNDADIRDLLNLMDRDGSGSIDFKEFADVMASQFYKTPSESDLRAAFDFFDSDQSGHISEEELFKAMSRFRGGITKADIHRMVAKIDKDNDGKINYKGLCDLCFKIFRRF